MKAGIKKFAIKVPQKRANQKKGSTFFTLAKKHIVKGKRGGDADLSRRIDEVVYGK